MGEMKWQASERGVGMNLGVLEVLERDGQVGQTHVIADWPLHIGRAVDNDVVLPDPHVARHHLRIVPGENGLELHVGQTLNGARTARRQLRGGMWQSLPETGEPVEIGIGRTRLRLRLPGHNLPPEMPLAISAVTGLRRASSVTLGVLLLVAALAFDTWLDSDPDTFLRALGSMLLASLVAAAVWCGLWALVSKTFTRQTQFAWHLKVFAWASLGWMVTEALADSLAFALSWPWLSDFSFAPLYAVAAVAFYFHLLAVEPARPRLLRGVATVALVTAVGLQLWFNQQRTDRYGSDLYMSQLLPPAARIAKPVSVDTLVDSLFGLQTVVDKKALEAPRGGGAGGDDGQD
jgi:FHA domain